MGTCWNTDVPPPCCQWCNCQYPAEPSLDLMLYLHTTAWTQFLNLQPSSPTHLWHTLTREYWSLFSISACLHSSVSTCFFQASPQWLTEDQVIESSGRESPYKLRQITPPFSQRSCKKPILIHVAGKIFHITKGPAWDRTNEMNVAKFFAKTTKMVYFP